MYHNVFLYTSNKNSKVNILIIKYFGIMFHMYLMTSFSVITIYFIFYTKLLWSEYWVVNKYFHGLRRKHKPQCIYNHSTGMIYFICTTSIKNMDNNKFCHISTTIVYVTNPRNGNKCYKYQSFSLSNLSTYYENGSNLVSRYLEYRRFKNVN